MKKTLLIAGSLVLVIALAFFFYLNSGKAEIFIKDGAAINGYDPVAYFTEQKPVKGSKDFSYNYKKATWHFSSQQNMDLFKANPDKYAPKYGGYCAYGLSNGYKAPTEADAWSIVDEKLYLNYNTEVREEWNKEQKQRIINADQNWPVVKTKE